MFTDDEIASILSDFPKFELSYETMTHKKVFDYNVILAIPDGQKCFAWFTSYKDDNVCFIMDINTNTNTITNVYTGLTGFNDKLALGTILYGTIVNINGTSCFFIEDLYYYKGVNYSGKTFISRLETLKTVLKHEISQHALTSNYIVFGLPFMGTDLLVLLKNIETLPYKPMYLKYRWYETKKIMCSEYYSRAKTLETIRPTLAKNLETIRPETIRPEIVRPTLTKNLATGTTNLKQNLNQKQNQLPISVFNITPDVRSDIYNLFISNDGNSELEFYDYAFIPDYETSVKMNKLFRNIKENENLDALEESDDEDDFENDKIDKYVYLDRSYKMNCQFNYKFKKWMPISVANTKDAIVSYRQLHFTK